MDWTVLSAEVEQIVQSRNPMRMVQALAHLRYATSRLESAIKNKSVEDLERRFVCLN